MKWANRIFNAAFAVAWFILARYFGADPFIAGSIGGFALFALGLDDRLRALETARGGEGCDV